MRTPVRYIVIYLLLPLFFGASVVVAQSGKIGSRLAIKPKEKTTQIKTLQNQRFLKLPVSNSLTSDFSTDLSKFRLSSIYQYFNNLLTQQQGTPSRKSVAVKNLPVAEKVTITQPVLAEENTLQTVEKLFVNDKISISNIYPNPADDYTQIDFTLNNRNTEAKILIYNILGAVVKEYDLDPDAQRLQISTSQMPSGVYLYQLSLDRKLVVAKKMIVKHE